MKTLFKTVFALIIIGVVLTAVWFSLDSHTKCKLIYGKNICNFYEMMDMVSTDPERSDFEKAMPLCRDMKDVPKKDSCFDYIAQLVSFYDTEKAREACNEIKGFDNVHSKEDCLNKINQYFLYSNQDYGYTLKIPKDWVGKFEIREDEKSTSFIYGLITELKEPIFTIVVYSKNEWERLTSEPGYHGTEITEKNDTVFVYVLPLENPYELLDRERADEFQGMVGDVQTIIGTFELVK